MKKIIVVIAVAALLSLNAFAKTGTEVPANVKNAFTQKFPNVTKVKWENENGKEWEAEFKMDGKPYSASFDMRGSWMETEYKLATKDIPAPVQKTILADFKDCKVKKSEMSESANGKCCEFLMKKGTEKKEVTIDMNGKVLKNEVVKEDNEAKEAKESVTKTTKEVKEPVQIQKTVKEPKPVIKKETKVVK
jgi:hypothetical protein